ncbi:hypothetical protein FRIG_15760 [Frigoribacterium faeni]|nr:hypothetical protein [Frigoribacterium faeni]MCJ0702567.1 hypothetical protein [Frigoribacterium faeni]
MYKRQGPHGAQAHPLAAPIREAPAVAVVDEVPRSGGAGRRLSLIHI